MNKLSFRIAILSLFTAFTLILSYIEFLLPLNYGYGLKLGLANIAIVAILYVFSFKEALIVNLLRIFISGLLFGNLIGLIFSLSGGLLSILAMYFSKKIKLFSILTVSIIGALFHNMGQICAAYIVTEVPGLFMYLPVLLFGGIITGTVIGVLANIIIRVLKEIIRDDSIYKR